MANGSRKRLAARTRICWPIFSQITNGGVQKADCSHICIITLSLFCVIFVVAKKFVGKEITYSIWGVINTIPTKALRSVTISRLDLGHNPLLHILTNVLDSH